MSVSAPARQVPPKEEFWTRYSPHYEFPLSGIGSIAMHIAALAVFLGALWLLAKLTISDRAPVPMSELSVTGTIGDGDGKEGSNDAKHQEMDDPIPAARRTEVANEISAVLPKVPDAESGLRPENLPSIPSLARLNEDMRRALTKGIGPKNDSGQGTTGTGPDSRGNSSSSEQRAVRWELNFKTTDGDDYLHQLKAMKATLVIPIPPNWSVYKTFKDLSRPMAEPFVRDELPRLYFIDDAADSTGKLAKALGLDFSPPRFIAFFPKDVEEDLARKERAYLGRKESEIFSTKFKVLIRDGKPEFAVVD